MPLRNYFFMCLVKRSPGTMSEFPCLWFRKATHFLLYPFDPPSANKNFPQTHTMNNSHKHIYMHTIQEEYIHSGYSIGSGYVGETAVICISRRRWNGPEKFYSVQGRFPMRAEPLQQLLLFLLPLILYLANRKEGVYIGKN